MTKRLLSAIALTIAVSLFACSACAAAAKFTVEQFSPTGETDGAPQIRIVFGKEVVPQSAVGQPLSPDKMPVTFTPMLFGAGMWEDELTFIYQPSASSLAPATEFTANINKELRSRAGDRIGGKLSFKFNSPPLKYISARQIDFDIKQNYVDYLLKFSQKVDPEKLMGYLEVSDAHGKMPFLMMSRDPVEEPHIRVAGGDATAITIKIAAGMPPVYGTLGLASAVTEELPRDMSMRIQSVYARTEINGSAIFIDTTSPVNHANLASYIETVPQRKLSIYPMGNTVRVEGNFSPRDRVRLRVKKGLSSAMEYPLANQWEGTLIIPDYRPEIAFDADGRFITPVGDRPMLPISTVNLDEIEVSAHRIYDNNVSVALRGGWPYDASGLSERVFGKKYRLSGIANQTVKSSIDLEAVLGGRRGIFELRVSRPSGWPYETKIINVTDLAPSVKLFDSSIAVWVCSLREAEPVANASVSVINHANQTVASGKTDKNGLFVYNNKSSWGYEDMPSLVIASKGDDTAALPLESNVLGRFVDQFSGEPYRRGTYRGICFTPRGVYRPGETINAGAIVREDDLSTAKTFPVVISLRDPMGRVMETRTPMLSKFGAVSADFRLSEAAASGVWHIDVSTPGADAKIASAQVIVRDFVPPRVKVDVSSDKSVLTGSGSGNLGISAEYTFGSAVQGARYEAEARIIPYEYRDDHFPGYIFNDCRVKSGINERRIADGLLNREGRANVKFGDLFEMKDIYRIAFSVSVMQDDGRWAYGGYEAKYFPGENIVGILPPDGTITARKRIRFGVCAAGIDGKALERPMKYTISRKVSNVTISLYNNNESPEGNYVYIPEDGLTDVPINGGEKFVELELKSGGEYVFILSDPESGASAAVPFYVFDSSWSYGETEAVLPDMVSVRLDKTKFKPGERINGRLSVPFSGRALITVETDEILQSKVVNCVNGGCEFTFDATDKMIPNAWITAQLVRSVTAEEHWTSHRAFGAANIDIDCENLSLRTEVSVPPRMNVEGSAEITVRVTDSSGRPVECEAFVSLTDEAIWSMTDMPNPNLYKQYIKRREVSASLYDVYQDLIRIYTSYPAPLAPGGGDMEEANDAALSKRLISPVNAERFKPYTRFYFVTTDSGGTATINADRGEFTGLVRAEAVTVSKSAFGSASAATQSYDDVIADISLPRALSPGDIFYSDIKVYNMTSSDVKAAVKLDADGPLKVVSIDSDGKVIEISPFIGSMTLAPDGTMTALNVAMMAGEACGAADIKLSLEYGGHKNEKKYQIAVRPPSSYSTSSIAYRIEPGERKAISLSGDYFDGTREAGIYLSGAQNLSSFKMMKFLMDYPYDCMEQVISSAWGYLYLPVLYRHDAELFDAVQAKQMLNDKIRRIQNRQLADGGFGLWPGYESSGWITAYAAHFLLAAKAMKADIPQDTLNSALQYLKLETASGPSGIDTDRIGADAAARAYICYVLTMAGERPLGWLSYLRDIIGEIPEYGRTFLAASYARIGEVEIAKNILGDDTPIADIVSGDASIANNYDSAMRSLALRLIARNEIDPRSAQALVSAGNLIAAADSVAYFNTQEAAYAVMALGDYSAYNSAGDSGCKLIVYSDNGAMIAETGKGSFAAAPLSDDIRGIEAVNDGDAPGFISINISGVPKIYDGKRPRADKGMSATAQYKDETGIVISANRAIKYGDKVYCDIEIKPLGSSLKDVAVTQILPAGLEIERGTKDDETGDTNIRIERRDDRIVLYIERLDKTIKERIVLRAVTPGKFTAPAIYAESMYNPAIYSSGEHSVITIAK